MVPEENAFPVDPECCEHIRFKIDDTDGSLRFRRIDMAGMPICHTSMNRLSDYLCSRPLHAVRMEEIRSVLDTCKPGCRAALIQVIEELLTRFTAPVNP